MMETQIAKNVDWQQMRARLARLEEAHGRLRSRGLLALRFNIVVIVGIALWLAWPGKTLMSERLTTHTIGADTVWSGYTRLDQESALITGRHHETSTGMYREAWMTLGYSGARDPRLTLWNDRDGKIAVTIYGAPALRMYTDTGSESLRVGPQLELRFDAGWSPEIVLRDVHGQVVWRAP